MRNINKFLSLGLALSLTAVPVLAEDATITTSGTNQDVQVTADVASSWEVTIPKEVVLTNPDGGSGDYTGTIPVTVKGDIGTAEVITVDTNGDLALSDTTGANAEAVNAAITKGNTEFNFAALTGGQTAETSHSVEATLTPGEWKGILQFNINLATVGSQTPVTSPVAAYDENGEEVATWAELGIDLSLDYEHLSGDSNYYKTAETSGYYALTNRYPTATKVVIPEGETRIGKGAFDGCTTLTSIEIPASVTFIGNSAFTNCGITSITLPDGLSRIDAYALECPNLTSVTWRGTTYTDKNEFNQALATAGIELGLNGAGDVWY